MTRYDSDQWSLQSSVTYLALQKESDRYGPISINHDKTLSFKARYSTQDDIGIYFTTCNHALAQVIRLLWTTSFTSHLSRILNASSILGLGLEFGQWRLVRPLQLSHYVDVWTLPGDTFPDADASSSVWAIIYLAHNPEIGSRHWPQPDSTSMVWFQMTLIST